MDTDVTKRMSTIVNYLGLTQMEFANKLNIQRSTITHILSGRNLPSISILQKISATYPQLSMEWLISGVGEMLKVTNVTKESDVTVKADKKDAEHTGDLEKVVLLSSDGTFKVYSQK